MAIQQNESTQPILEVFEKLLYEELDSATSPTTALLELRVSPAAVQAWRKLKPSDWKKEGWEGEDQDLTSPNRSEDVYLKALKERLARVNVVHVVKTNESEPYMEVVAVKAAGES
jgi:hypothetical protein